VSVTVIHTAAAATSSSAARHAYRPDIDGLRAIAILSVVLHHAGVPFLPGGFTGVDIFFVISGYLIGGHIYANIRDRSFSYLRFYQHRARRILPAFYIVLLFTFAAALVLLSPAETRTLARDAFAATLSASNISFWRFANYFDARSSLQPLLMTWSLGVEEQFYLVIPLLMALLARLRPRFILPAILIACVLSLLLAQLDLGIVPMRAFYLLPHRAWELGIGVALAVFKLDRRPMRLPPPLMHFSACAGLALILAPFILLTPHSAFPGLAALPSVVGAAILIALPTSIVNRRLLALAPMVFVGRISYSWYLWHWPLLAFLRIATADSLALPIALLAVALAFVLSVLSWRFVEQPFRRSTTPPAPLLQRYAAVSLAILAICSALWISDGFPQRFPTLAAIEAPTTALKADPCSAGSHQDTPNLSPSCYPSPAALPAVALWGDSHATALAPGLRTFANARGYAFDEITKNGCTPLIGATHTIPRIPSLAVACRHFNHAAFSVIQSDSHIRIVVLAASWSAPLERTWMDGWLASDSSLEAAPNSATASVPTAESNLRLYRAALAAIVHGLQAAGKQVVLVQDAPSFAVDPLLLISTAHIPARRAIALALNHASGSHPNGDPGPSIDPGYALPESSPAITDSIALLQQASQQLSIQLLDPKPALCLTPAQCAYRDGDTLLYIDTTHLSAAGSRRALTSFPLPAAR
jgi:peptidoglycan/LPS O-acetylase OafA/YrhL